MFGQREFDREPPPRPKGAPTMRISLEDLQLAYDLAMKSAIANHAKAMMYENRANDYRAKIREEEHYRQSYRAKAGNEMSRLLVSPGYEVEFERLVDQVCSNDPVWRGLVDNNKFYTRKANLDNNMVTNLREEIKSLEGN